MTVKSGLREAWLVVKVIGHVSAGLVVVMVRYAKKSKDDFHEDWTEVSEIDGNRVTFSRHIQMINS